MGLDGVELVMSVEERFGVRLRDDDLHRVRTVADLAALVCTQMVARTPQDGVCPSSRAFYAIRRGLVAHGGVARASVRPGTLLMDLLPGRRTRRRVWRRLRIDLGSLPPLKLSPGKRELWGVLAFGAMVFSAALGLVVWETSGGFAGVGAAIVALALSLWLVCLLSDHWETEYPTGLATVADAVRSTWPMELNREGQRLIAESSVLEEVRRLTAEQIGAKLEEVHPHSEFLRDLRIG